MINHEELRAKYNPEGSELRNLQYKMLEEIKLIDKICKENNITYFLTGGSALGAVRHNGFIPWDDDMDIALLKKDYKKLCKILLNLDSDKYVLQCHKTDINYISDISKLREKEGILLGSNPQRARLYKYKGVCIDIFCIERSSYICCYLTHLLRRCLLNKQYLIKNKNIRRVSISICYALYRFTKLILSFLNIFAKRDEIHYSPGQGAESHYMRLIDIYPVKYMEFENYYLPIPNNYDSFLRRIFGDYMKLPQDLHFHNKWLENNFKK